MADFTVRITEHLRREFTVSADSWSDALGIAAQMWRDQEVVLDAGDFTHATVSVGDSDEFDL